MPWGDHFTCFQSQPLLVFWVVLEVRFFWAYCAQNICVYCTVWSAMMLFCYRCCRKWRTVNSGVWMLPNKQFHKIICILVNVYVYIGICIVGQYWLVVCLCMTRFAWESRSAFHLYLLILLAKQGWRATHWEVQSAKLMPSTLRQCMCMCVCVCTRTKRLLDLAASCIPHLNCFNCSQSTNAGT